MEEKLKFDCELWWEGSLDAMIIFHSRYSFLLTIHYNNIV